MKLSAAIMAHPVRRAEAEAVQAALDRPVPIVYDPNPVPSANPAQRWATGAAAWEAHDPDADWHLVIQDDAVPCRDLLAGLERALDELGPDGVVSAYTGRGRPNQPRVQPGLDRAAAGGHSWMWADRIYWGVAIAAPVKTIPGMLAWCSHHQRAREKYDARIGRYFHERLGWRAWYTVPALVDHRGGKSLIGHGDKGRHAYWVHRGSALDIDWTRVPDGGLRVKAG